jgi:anti-anti-sigma factor
MFRGCQGSKLILEGKLSQVGPQPVPDMFSSRGERMSLESTVPDLLDITLPDIRPSDLLSIEVSWVEDTAIMGLRGEVCMMSVALLYARFREVSNHLRGGLVIDLGLVTFLDSTGLSFMISTQKQLEARGQSLVIYAPSSRIRRLFAICGLTSDLVIVPETADEVGGTIAG